MTTPPIAVVILAAGHGSRMKSATSKVLHQVGGLSLLGHVMASAAALSPARQAVIIGDHAMDVGDAASAINPEIFVGVQAPPRGTGDAVMQAAPALEGFDGVVLVLYADTPFIRLKTLEALVNAVAENKGVGVLGFRPDQAGAYGRLKTNDEGGLEAIIEAKDATEEELQIGFVNAGVMAIDSAFLARGLPQLSPENAKNEYYLTDLVAIARAEGLPAAAIEASEDEVVGVNARAELATAEVIFQDLRRDEVMDAGVTLIDPATTYLSYDTEIEPDVIIEPNVWFGPGVKVESGARIKAFSHIEGAHIGPNAQIGPFARLRPGAKIGDSAKIGNFVEVKNAAIGDKAAASHLTYIGDAEVGARANIGAGTITCNYDGVSKHKTAIGDDAFIGSNTALVAPVTIGAGASIGAGSVITKNVSADALAVARGRQTMIEGWAARFRKSKGKG